MEIVNILKDTDECKSCEWRNSIIIATWKLEHCSNPNECNIDKEELEFYD